ncbi:LytTR family DNA-binding domain-containing protein [Brevundimonas kwangchunensis]|uniref:LytTR family DNA-binding domain-containing protein n=1 Tax=Brevundimonas kwangchunensis TaxID=322163 RepID=A0ABP3S6W4_9CAUL
MRIVVADEDARALAGLKSVLETDRTVQVVGAATDVAEAVSLIERLRPNLVFLDVHIPVRSGLPLARALTTTPNVEVVFTASPEDLSRLRGLTDGETVLLKPFDPDQLERLLADARKKTAAGSTEVGGPIQATPAAYVDAFWAPGIRGLNRVDVSAIEWIEAARDYVLLHTEARSHILRATMSGLERQLDPSQMVRVSRSAFVRRDRIVGVARQGGCHLVLLAGGRSVRIGATYGRLAEELGAQFADGTLS